MTRSSPMTFTGHHAPASGFEAPFDMLGACHERVQRMLALLERLQKHAHTNGCDAQAKQAAVDVMRYFDLAAPLHHQDEELHVFPLLLHSQELALQSAALALVEQHRGMEKAWSAMRVVLEELVLCDTAKPFSALRLEDVQSFASLYEKHIDLEEQLVYPAASDAISDEALTAASEDMMRRRGVKPLTG